MGHLFLFYFYVIPYVDFDEKYIQTSVLNQ